MKAETKAKRRVTLSISGLGWTDETEIESIPNAKKVEVNLETGEIIDVKSSQTIPGTNASLYVPPYHIADAGKVVPGICTDHNEQHLDMVQNTSRNHIVDSNEMIVDAPRKISKDMWVELNNLIEQCNPNFKQKLWDKVASMGINSIEDLDEETYKKIKDA